MRAVDLAGRAKGFRGVGVQGLRGLRGLGWVLPPDSNSL